MRQSDRNERLERIVEFLQAAYCSQYFLLVVALDDVVINHYERNASSSQSLELLTAVERSFNIILVIGDAFRSK